MLHKRSPLYPVRAFNLNMFSRSAKLVGFLVVGLLAVSNGITYAYESQYFMVTAYYSPLPGQSYYLNGDYETEIYVNGRGTHGSSGQPVRPGMIAAPRNYPFGAKIALEGIGVGTVLDRGGAIVEAEESGSFTRLDIYMGIGEEGLCRAMKFGVRSVYGTVFTLEESQQILHDTIDFARFPSNCSFVTGANGASKSSGSLQPSLRQRVLTNGVLPTSSKAEITELKRLFDETGYLIGPVSDVYDRNLINTIYRFQVSQGIVSSPYDEGAGYYGPQTRRHLLRALQKSPEEASNDASSTPPPSNQMIKQPETSIFDIRITEWSSENEIRELQFVLRNLGYFSYEQDGVFNKRLVDAIFAFQKDHDIVSSPYEVGAGYYGPKTRATLQRVYKLYQDRQIRIQEKQKTIDSLTTMRAQLLQTRKEEYSGFLESLGILREGDISPQVRHLQKLLKQLGYMEARDTAIFGLATKGGLAAYQLDLGVIEKLDSPYAGILGPVTRQAIVDDLLRRFNAEDRTHIAEMEALKQEITSLQDITST